MAEAHINTAFGAASFLGTTVRGSLAAFSLWQKTENAGELFEFFKTRLEIQRARLHWWSIKWGIDEATQISEISDLRFQCYQDAIFNYLRLIRYTMYHLAAVDDKFPGFTNARAAQLSTASNRLATMLNPELFTGYGADEVLINADSSLSEKIKWALQDGRATERLELLSTLIGDLEHFVPPPNPDPSGAAIVNHNLAKNDPQSLSKLSQRSDIDPVITTLAWMKSVIMTHINDVPFLYELAECKDFNIEPKGDYKKSCRRFMGKYDGGRKYCLVEKKPILFQGEENSDVLRHRIEKLACLLKSAHKPAELKTPRFLGFRHETGSGKLCQESGFSLIYESEADDFFSLEEMLESKGKFHAGLSLDRRFEFARTLAKALLYLHTVEWLHKGIRSSNIVFFANRNDQHSIINAQPYLVGFEYSRIDAIQEESEPIVDTEDSNLYRHPDAQGLPCAAKTSPLGERGRFQKKHDIYALGVVLVELGTSKLAPKLNETCPKEDCENGATAFREYLLKVANKGMRYHMGNTYADATIACLEGKFDGNDQLLVFHQEVVSKLEKCNA